MVASAPLHNAARPRWTRRVATRFVEVAGLLARRVFGRGRGAVQLDALDPRRILFCRPDHIGDAFLSVPALAWLRERYPAAHITLLVASWSAPMFRARPFCDDVLVYDPPWWTRNRARRFGTAQGAGGWLELARFVRQLRAQRFDLCVEARGDMRQMLFFGVLGGAGVIVSRNRHGGALMVDSAPAIDESLHEIDQNLALVGVLGAPGTAATVRFHRPFGSDDEAVVEALLSARGLRPTDRFVVAHPGAKWVNQWPQASWADWLDQLMQRSGVHCVVTGAPAEAPLCARLAAQSPRAHDLSGQLSLTGMAALMARAAMVVMCDTGPMHFLNALDTPALLLYGPTDPRRFAPRGAHIRVLAGGTCCQAALHEECLRTARPEASDCMRSLAVSAVLEASLAGLVESGD